MALTNQLRLRTGFLLDAAHLLAASSPAVAAFLGTTRNRLVEDAELELPPKELEAFRRELCGACGSPLIPGWSCKVSGRPRLGENKKGNGGIKELTKSQKSTVYTCLRCHRETVQTVLPKPSKPLRKSKIGSVADTVADMKPLREGGSKVTKTVNASSKQRQKARKGGLQAMLEKNKTQTSSLEGLDLMDFAM